MKREAWTKERVRAGVAALLLEALLGYALIVGLGIKAPAPVHQGLEVLGILPDPTPPPPKRQPKPPPAPIAKPAGAAAPPNLKAIPTEIVRPPPPPIVLPPPPPIVAAPMAGTGAAASAGAAPVPGKGAGGEGNGFGAGRGGSGIGSGIGIAVPARFLKGELRDRDYPRALGDAGIGGTVTMRFVVGSDGRVSDCRVIGSSGNAELDETTCRLVEQRYRYKPARDSQGRAVPSTDTDEHEWISRPPVPEDE